MRLTAELGRDRRAAIALITGLTMPVLLMSVAMGIEIGRWSDVKLQLQRTADLAALAGAESYGAGASAQTAANAAANVAEFNAGIGGSGRTWTASSQTLSDNQITVQITTGVNNPKDPAVRVTVIRPVPLLFASFALGTGSITMGATALTEVGTTVNGSQPCVLTLNGYSSRNPSASGTTLSGNVNINLSGCSMVSDGTASVNGNVTLNAAGVYAAGSITMHGNVSGTGTTAANQHQSSAQIPDPYATNTALQSAIGQAECSPTTQPVASEGVINLYPNVCYGAISISGNNTVTFNGTGLYTVNGSLTIAGNTQIGGTTISGSGVTLVTAGAISISGNFNTSGVVLTAPTAASAENGAIPGVLFATGSAGGVTIAGNSGFTYSGLMYAPNSAVSFHGNVATGSSECSEIVSSTLTIAGNVGLGANCSNYGLLNYGSQPKTTTIGLVQ